MDARRRLARRGGHGLTRCFRIVVLAALIVGVHGEGFGDAEAISALSSDWFVRRAEETVLGTVIRKLLEAKQGILRASRRGRASGGGVRAEEEERIRTDRRVGWKIAPSSGSDP